MRIYLVKRKEMEGSWEALGETFLGVPSVYRTELQALSEARRMSRKVGGVKYEVVAFEPTVKEEK